jgi:16S rRNA processing protein RimM
LAEDGKAPSDGAEGQVAGERQVTLAAIAGAHGIGGEVRLKLFAQSADSIARHGAVTVGGRILTLKSVKANSGGAIVRFAEILDRNAAEALRGTLLTVPRSALPPLGEGEYYHSDIIGLPCETEAGEPLGSVVAIEDFGAGDVIEIEKPDGKRTMVPFRAGIADLADGRIMVDPLFLA